VLALEIKMKTERVQTPGDVWMGAPEHGLPQRQGLLALRDGVSVLALIPERVRRVEGRLCLL
jgi:hypothetical protein